MGPSSQAKECACTVPRGKKAERAEGDAGRFMGGIRRKNEFLVAHQPNLSKLVLPSPQLGSHHPNIQMSGGS